MQVSASTRLDHDTVTSSNGRSEGSAPPCANARVSISSIGTTGAILHVVVLVAALVTIACGETAEPVSFPVVSEDVSALDPISPVAPDGHRGSGLLRKPVGPGPFPAVILLHAGLAARSVEALTEYARQAPVPSRYLAAGYVVAVMTFRSRDVDPQSAVSLEDSLAAVNHLRALPYVDSASIVVHGCSGGGDLALELSAATEVAAIVAEEPASMLFAGIMNTDLPKRGERYTAADSIPIMRDPLHFYTATNETVTRDKISRITAPILLLQGDEGSWRNAFNAQVLIPALRSAGAALEVISYPREPHCFAFRGGGPSTPRPAVALEAFRAADAFLRQHLNTQPTPIDPALMDYVLVN